MGGGKIKTGNVSAVDLEGKGQLSGVSSFTEFQGSKSGHQACRTSAFYQLRHLSNKSEVLKPFGRYGLNLLVSLFCFTYLIKL